MQLGRRKKNQVTGKYLRIDFSSPITEQPFVFRVSAIALVNEQLALVVLYAQIKVFEKVQAHHLEGGKTILVNLVLWVLKSRLFKFKYSSQVNSSVHVH